MGDATPTTDSNGFMQGLKETDYQALLDAKTNALRTVRERDEEILALKHTITVHNTKISTLTKAATTNQATLASLTSALREAHNALKDGGKHTKAELKEAITRKVVDWIRDVGFRTVKFAKGQALDRFVTRVFAAIKDDLDLLNEAADHHTPLDEFKHIYTGYIQKQLGDRRQYVQTQILKACIGKA